MSNAATVINSTSPVCKGLLMAENGVAGTAMPDAADVRNALAQVLASDAFARCQRLRRLLRFLVEERLVGASAQTSEYVIGIEVFDRDADTYNTGDDPIVRVQVGRLRERLQQFYANAGSACELAFHIPKGSYMPVILRRPGAARQRGGEFLMALRPFACIPFNDGYATFARGLDEELGFRLFREFGGYIVTHIEPDTVNPTHVVEGSLRVDGGLARVCVRLIDMRNGSLVWSGQLDRQATFSIRLQEELALAICDSLREHFRPV